MKAGILALQGDVREHAAALADLDVESRPVRTPADLALVDALILPGGESTTISMLLESSGLYDAIAERLTHGMPALGTSAGMILLAREVIDGRADQRTFDAIDISVRRNGYGRQVDSFEADLDIDPPLPAVFIRAPLVVRVGSAVEVLAEFDGHAVLCRQDNVLVAAFHPEISGDRRVHRLFVEGG